VGSGDELVKVVGGLVGGGVGDRSAVWGMIRQAEMNKMMIRDFHSLVMFSPLGKLSIIRDRFEHYYNPLFGSVQIVPIPKAPSLCLTK